VPRFCKLRFAHASEGRSSAPYSLTDPCTPFHGELSFTISAYLGISFAAVWSSGFSSEVVSQAQSCRADASALDTVLPAGGDIDFARKREPSLRSLVRTEKSCPPAGGTMLWPYSSRRTLFLVSTHGSSGPAPAEELFLDLEDGPRRLRELIPSKTRCFLVVLSACESGVYQMSGGDFPLGGAPELLRAGVQHCVGARFRLNALFAANFFSGLWPGASCRTHRLRRNAEVSSQKLGEGFDLWRDVGCLELLSTF